MRFFLGSLKLPPPKKNKKNQKYPVPSAKLRNKYWKIEKILGIFAEETEIFAEVTGTFFVEKKSHA